VFCLDAFPLVQVNKYITEQMLHSGSALPKTPLLTFK